MPAKSLATAPTSRCIASCHSARVSTDIRGRLIPRSGAGAEYDPRGNPNASSDADNDGGESQVLLRFDAIIGSEPGMFPPRATVHSAKLVISAFDEGNTVNLHRMLVPFGRAATWNSLVSGVSADGLEASRHKDSFTFGKIAANSSEIIFEVTDTVQAWVNGEANHGWLFLNSGGNGWDFYTSEFENVAQCPKLVVEFTIPN